MKWISHSPACICDLAGGYPTKLRGRADSPRNISHIFHPLIRPAVRLSTTATLRHFPGAGGGASKWLIAVCNAA